MQQADQELLGAKEHLERAEQTASGPTDSALLEPLDRLARLYRQSGRLLDGANMEARAKLIREKAGIVISTVEDEKAKIESQLKVAGGTPAVVMTNKNSKSSNRLNQAVSIKTTAIVVVCAAFLILLMTQGGISNVGSILYTLAVALPVLTIIFCLYFLPTLVAVYRKKQNVKAIAILNTFLGWTLVGWVVSLVWAVSVEATTATVSVPVTPPVGDMVDCPKCGETIKRKAVLCRFCQSDLSA